MNTNTSKQTIFWYDLETFGLDSRYDRIAQFAGQRTDLNLNPIGEPTVFVLQTQRRLSSRSTFLHHYRHYPTGSEPEGNVRKRIHCSNQYRVLKTLYRGCWVQQHPF
nr:exonuclease domain-containing protein [uncultured Sphaerochaeta sp.]